LIWYFRICIFLKSRITLLRLKAYDDNHEKILGKSIFKATGWQYNVDPKLLENKQVIIGFEHTSNLDTILSLALFEILELKIHTLIKKNYSKALSSLF
jgi:hypothetical protein